MRKIDRQGEPVFWTEYKRAHPKEQYADLKKSTEGNMMRHQMRGFLMDSQYGLCAYCCRSIVFENSLNEHIKPQSCYPKETMRYENLIASCKTEGTNATCGVKKENDYDETLFVSPLEMDCEESFIFYPNGQIQGVGPRGEYTCKILNLNAYELQRARKAQFKVCSSYNDPEMVYSYFLLPDSERKLEPYADMIQYFYRRGDFEAGKEDGDLCS